jgi:NADPH-dependent 2,4-dienoyl-CoA reductase/sulfur reductase-like enzyme
MEEGSTGIERRDFLKAALVTGAAAAATTALSACAPKVSEDKPGSATTPPQAAMGPEINNAAQSLRKWSFEVAPDPIAESEIAETIEADVVVVGAGVSGLVTANSAIEEGLSVVVVSASSAPFRVAALTMPSTARQWSGPGFPAHQ